MSLRFEFMIKARLLSLFWLGGTGAEEGLLQGRSPFHSLGLTQLDEFQNIPSKSVSPDFVSVIADLGELQI